jgi:uncharacterized Fe-S cluster-containing radical SAM superfamily enzyme
MVDLTKSMSFLMLVYMDSEPLVRPDLLKLLHHSKRASLTNVIDTNGTLINEELAFKLREAGVVRGSSQPRFLIECIP